LSSIRFPRRNPFGNAAADHPPSMVPGIEADVLRGSEVAAISGKSCMDDEELQGSTAGGIMNEEVLPTPQRVPWHLWLVGILGLLFNSVGAFDYVMMQTRIASYVGRFTPEHFEVLYGLPAWFVACWAIAVWGGTLRAVLVLPRRRIVMPVLSFLFWP
jgi:hypothetical protein